MSSSERAASPTPSERERLDAEARKKEEAEQATLPYKWTQKIGEVDVTIPIPGNLKSKDLIVEIKKTRIKAQVKGQEALIEVGVQSTSPTMMHYYPYTLARGHADTRPLRGNFPTRLCSTNAPGPLKRLPRAKKSPSTLTSSTNPNGGHML
jgi:CS domain